MSDPLKIIITSDGSHSLYHPTLKETYHSTHGALTESQYVFIQEGIEHLISLGERKLDILEIGFGTGLNALLVWDFALKNPSFEISFTTLEPFPLSEELYKPLNYAELLNGALMPYDLTKLHDLEWGEFHELSNNFRFVKHLTKLENFESGFKFNLVFYDAFAPSKQAEMWGKEPLDSIYKMLVKNGVLTTYCAQGQFKRNLAELGMEVETLKGPPGKKEMVRALRKQ